MYRLSKGLREVVAFRSHIIIIFIIIFIIIKILFRIPIGLSKE